MSTLPPTDMSFPCCRHPARPLSPGNSHLDMQCCSDFATSGLEVQSQCHLQRKAEGTPLFILFMFAKGHNLWYIWYIIYKLDNHCNIYNLMNLYLLAASGCYRLLLFPQVLCGAQADPAKQVKVPQSAANAAAVAGQGDQKVVEQDKEVPQWIHLVKLA